MINDRAERKALERKWDLLQQFNTHYENWHPSSKHLNIPTMRFTIKDRTITETRTILDGLQAKGIFIYALEGDNFCFTDINHEEFIKEYAKTSAAYHGHNDKPSYNPTLNQLNFRGKTIRILDNSGQGILCRTLFKNTRTINREWQNGELFTKITGEQQYDSTKWHKVYDIAYALNLKIASETQIADLFIATKFIVRLNPKYF